ncbi:MAG: hypothetical protein M1554_03590 [Patescibacteria group bacterium]|jgi:hypothetical protein|nr:hypothetical protein [Patescibacteria group bacterium]
MNRINQQTTEETSLENKFKEWRQILTDSNDPTRLESNGAWASMLVLLRNLFRYHLYEDLYIKSSIPINPIIKRAFRDNYVDAQSIAIRRMFSTSSEPDKQDNSLAKLWSEISQQTFDQEVLCSIYMSYNTNNLKTSPNMEDIMKNQANSYINQVINPRNNKIKNRRKINKILQLSKNEEAKYIYDKTNKGIAHAAQNSKIKTLKEKKNDYIELLKDTTIQLYKAYEALRFFVLFNTSTTTYIESAIDNDLTNYPLPTEDINITKNCWEKFRKQINEWESEGKELLKT